MDMKSAKLGTAALWSFNVLLIAAIVFCSCKYLFFRDRRDVLREVEPYTTDSVRATPAPAANYSSIQNFQNPVVPREKTEDPKAPTDIKADLLGTVPSDELPGIIAFLMVPTRNLYVNANYNEPVEQDGAPVPEFAGWKLMRVTRDSAVFSNGTRETELHSKDAPMGGATAGGGAALGGPSSFTSMAAGMTRDKVKVIKSSSTNDSDQFTIDRQSIAWAVENQDALLREVTLQDYASGGIQIMSIAPGSLAADFGFQPNDVIKSVNGQPITSSLSLAELKNSEVIKRATALTVGVERAGQIRAVVIRQPPNSK